ncbi:MAG: 1-deoxy-D-xylulose-5-phosphate synthase [Oscillospiraceae bacterium]|nr:1-deoxy-D-xylulose-5-phosphate synthase [Oscillospiraceae bacterium]
MNNADKYETGASDNDHDSPAMGMKLPQDLKRLSIPQCRQLCRKIRKTLIRTVGENGGHLSSNLGTVELTVSLHRVFDSPKDKIVWDVGHQAYTHKLLTDRYDRFSTIRQEGGLSGFARPSESEHDAFISGHSSISISAACGIGRAMQLSGDNEHHVVAVIGDGAFTGGEAYEGLNNAGKGLNNLIVVLNDNEMSISKNVGAIAKYLSSIRANEKYITTKHRTEKLLDSIPVVGRPVKEIMEYSKSTLRWILYHNTMFENMGFVYLGPVDGHDIAAMDEVFKAAKAVGKPVLVHVKTVKGKGFKPAEKNPGAFHGISAYELKYGNPEVISEDCFSAVFGRELTALAKKDDRICAVTAAMKYGTGLQYFASEFPDRFFDVGIAEQHAVTFCGGLASMGMIPVFSVYSSFLQRAYDQIIHDNAIPDNHIVLCIDRAGAVGEDGETHQGVFDVPMLTAVPYVTVFSPSDYSELKCCLNKALYETDGIAAVRYPKGKGDEGCAEAGYSDYVYDANGGSDILAVSYGRISRELFSDDIPCGRLRIIKINPISEDIVSICRNYKYILFFEESARNGGIGEHLLSRLAEAGFSGRYRIIAAEDFIPQAAVSSSLHRLGLDGEGMRRAISDAQKELIHEG